MATFAATAAAAAAAVHLRKPSGAGGDATGRPGGRRDLSGLLRNRQALGRGSGVGPALEGVPEGIEAGGGGPTGTGSGDRTYRGSLAGGAGGAGLPHDMAARSGSGALGEGATAEGPWGALALLQGGNPVGPMHKASLDLMASWPSFSSAEMCPSLPGSPSAYSGGGGGFDSASFSEDAGVSGSARCLCVWGEGGGGQDGVVLERWIRDVGDLMKRKRASVCPGVRVCDGGGGRVWL